MTAILEEFRERRGEMIGEAATLYIGGGTPSLMPGEQLRRLADGVREIAGKKGEWEEMTIEVNPEDVTVEKCLDWIRSGVNRVSMGVQTFSDAELKAIKRRHDSLKAEESVKLLKKYFDNVSIDLMFGLPGQTEESWRDSIEKALSLAPQHLSAYSLMLESGTPLTILNERGVIELPSEEESLRFFALLSERLRDAGYGQYEISNYALPGYESRHNRSYWLGTRYIGLGPAAHSYDGDRARRSNPWKIKEYLKRFGGTPGDALKPFFEEETLSDAELLEEKIMLSMRMREGIDLDLVKKMFGERNGSLLLRRGQKYIDEGLLRLQNGHLSLTRDGIMIADKIIVDLIP